MAIKTGSLWSADAISKATPGQWISGNPNGWSANNVNYYLSEVQPADLGITTNPVSWHSSFSDSTGFVNEYFNKGAIAVITDVPPVNIPPCYPVYLVKNSRTALKDLARAQRAQLSGKAICVTGSVGKTSVVRFLHHVLGQQALSYASDKNFNHNMGVALSLAQTPTNAKYSIYECAMEMNNEQMISKANLIRPDVALITNIAPVHLAYFKKDNPLAKVAEVKSQIFAALQPGGTAILNRDSEWFETCHSQALKHNAKHVLTFGEHHDADVRLLSCQLYPKYSTVKADICGEVIEYSIGLPGKHTVINTLTVIAAVYAIGGNWKNAALACVNLPRLNRHLQHITLNKSKGQYNLIDDTFNGSPISMKAAFDYVTLLEPKENGRRIAVLGDIGELAENGPAVHAELADAVITANFDLVFTIGELMGILHHKLPAHMIGLHAKTAKELKESLVENIAPNDIVLFKCGHYSAINKENIIKHIKRAL